MGLIKNKRAGQVEGLEEKKANSRDVGFNCKPNYYLSKRKQIIK